ncbi:SRPBCC family protein [Companilactobacillus metriopterae]|uniref:SRPBCC family protein n=1 Tax=Companilactobacillus metriopterae TaxID=1909267 RepID=UPI00100ACF2C|nr:SRPBCC family protein [Companilactobacillus metriopterae]
MENVKDDSVFFENEIDINSSVERLSGILLNLENITKWDHDIDTVKKDSDGFVIIRKTAAVNPVEHIQVRKENNRIIYISTMGKLEYKVIFTLTDNEGKVNLREDLILTNSSSIKLPLSILKPITKSAFKQVLEVLKAVSESENVESQF